MDPDPEVVQAKLRWYLDNNITEWDFFEDCLGVEGVELVGEALRTNAMVRKVAFIGIGVCNDGAKALAAVLQTNTTLQEVNLGSNRIGLAGAEALAEALRTNVTLRKLGLRGNGIGDDGATALAEALQINSTLQVVWLEGNGIGDDGAKALAEALQTNSTLQEVGLTDDAVSDELHQEIGQLLARNVVAAARQRLMEEPDTEELDLHGLRMGDSGARAIATTLKTNAGLRSLNLSGVGMGDNGARAIAIMLKTNAGLRSVNLSDNWIGNVGAQALLGALHDNETLNDLSLDGNSIHEFLLACLRELLARNGRLTGRTASPSPPRTRSPTPPWAVPLSPNGTGSPRTRSPTPPWTVPLSPSNSMDEALFGLLPELPDCNGRLTGRTASPSPPRTRSPTPPWTVRLSPSRTDSPSPLRTRSPTPPWTVPLSPSRTASPSRTRSPTHSPRAESVLALHRLLRRAVGQRRLAAGASTAIPVGFVELLCMLRAACPAAAVEERQTLVDGLEQRSVVALEMLAATQLAVRKAAASLSPAVSDDDVEAALQAVTAERDKSRAAAWRDLTDCAAQLLQAAVGGQGGAGVETVRQRRAEVERWIREAEGALAPCRQALGAEGGPLGRAGAAVEEAGRPVTVLEVLLAYDVWEVECSLATLTLATDQALRAVTAALAQTRLLTPPADDAEEEAERLAALMWAAEAALRAELAAWEAWDPTAHFPARLMMEGVRQLMAGWQAEVDFLQAVERHVAEWEAQAAEMCRVLNSGAKKADVVQRWLTAQVKLTEARLTAEMLDKQYALACVKKAPITVLAPQREAAVMAVKEARAAQRAATVGLVGAAADWPELACYVLRGLPEALLPLWESDRQVVDFENLQLIEGPSRNRVYRGTLNGQCVVLKGFPMTANSLHTCLREARRLVRAAHPHVVEVTALFQDSASNTPTFYLQMPDYTEGPLDRWARTHRPNATAVCRALRQAFDGVAHLHALGIIHSDLKPANLLVAGDGTVRVGDLDVSVESATRVSPYHASTVLTGFTVGYAAPELQRTGATKASDAYSLGVVVREVVLTVVPNLGEAAADLVRTLCAVDPAARPAVAAAMEHAYFRPAVAWEREEQRRCGVCKEEALALAAGVECVTKRGRDGHFLCDGCLQDYVTSLGSELRDLWATDGRIGCPQCPKGGEAGGVASPRVTYPDAEMARHLPAALFEKYIGVRLRLNELRLQQQSDAELRAEREMLLQLDPLQLRVREARRHVEEILNLRCPRCRLVFADFDDCCALSCSQCPCKFCAWCGKACSADSREHHDHVAQCPERPAEGVDDVFVPPEVWHKHQRNRRRRLVEAYVASLDWRTRRTAGPELLELAKGL